MARELYHSKQWRELRLLVLERDGWTCRIDDCGRRATEVDHVVPASEAPHLAFDLDNLRAAAKHCNISRKRRFNRVGASRRRPSRDW